MSYRFYLKLKPQKVNINKSLPPLPCLAASPVLRLPVPCLPGGRVRRRRLVSLGLRVHEDEAGEDGDDGDEY